MAGKLVLTISWQLNWSPRPSVLIHMGLSVACSGVLNTMMAEFRERVSIPREQGGSARHFYDLASEVTQPHLGYTLLLRQSQRPAQDQGEGT